MTKTAMAILLEALDLEEGERAAVAAALLESLEPAVDEREIEAAWRAEVKRRVSEIESGHAALIPWQSVRDQLRRRLAERLAVPDDDAVVAQASESRARLDALRAGAIDRVDHDDAMRAIAG